MQFKTGNIFDSKMQTITNTVNTQGVMGKGLALQFKLRYPEMFQDYAQKCQKEEVRAGRPYLYKQSTPWILNFPTKIHWKYSSKLEWIEAGLFYLRDHYQEWGITSLALAPLGCGLGKLNWNQVKGLILIYLDKTMMEIEVYEPNN